MKQFNKVRTTLTLDPEVHAYYEKIAQDQERSLSWIINNLLKEQMKKEGEK
jgi:hypothetical protein